MAAPSAAPVAPSPAAVVAAPAPAAVAPSPVVVATALLGTLLGSTVVGLRGNLWVWGLSASADVAFTVGTLLVAWFQVGLAARGPTGALAAATAGFLAHWLVYAVSWLLAAEVFSLRFVLWVGWGGLLVAAVVPALVGAWTVRRRQPASAVTGP